jgi:hypothetical protein
MPPAADITSAEMLPVMVVVGCLAFAETLRYLVCWWQFRDIRGDELRRQLRPASTKARHDLPPTHRP